MRVAIVGGGAAGLMCAAAIRETDRSAEVFLIERNDGLGKKVIISGGGRCNVTTGLQDVKEVLAHYPRGGRFLTSAMHAFPPAAVRAWFEAHGVPLKEQADRRVFPVSDDGRDIVRVFERLFEMSNVRVMLNASVVRVEKRGGQFAVSLKGNDEPLVVDRLVLTTGGQAYRHTGSTGDGYAFAVALGHRITPLAPSLNAFFTREAWPKELSGLSFARAKISTSRGKGFSFTGPFLFTHKGASGPAVFALSSLVAFEPYDAKRPLEISIDLFPDETAETLLGRLDAFIDDAGNKRFPSVLAALVPRSLADVLTRELSIHVDRPANQTSKNDRRRAVAWLKGIPLNVVQRGAGDEFVTAGGVALDEVDPKTMQSKPCPGLYFAGEILDVDGFTGGFNLQASWATGHLAGTNMA